MKKPRRAPPPCRTDQTFRKALHTDAGMTRFLDDIFGPCGYVYDWAADVWVSPDHDHTGPGRGFIIVERGGDWRTVIIPPGDLS